MRSFAVSFYVLALINVVFSAPTPANVHSTAICRGAYRPKHTQNGVFLEPSPEDDTCLDRAHEGDRPELAGRYAREGHWQLKSGEKPGSDPFDARFPGERFHEDRDREDGRDHLGSKQADAPRGKREIGPRHSGGLDRQEYVDGEKFEDSEPKAYSHDSYRAEEYSHDAYHPEEYSHDAYHPEEYSHDSRHPEEYSHDSHRPEGYTHDSYDTHLPEKYSHESHHPDEYSHDSYSPDESSHDDSPGHLRGMDGLNTGGAAPNGRNGYKGILFPLYRPFFPGTPGPANPAGANGAAPANGNNGLNVAVGPPGGSGTAPVTGGRAAPANGNGVAPANPSTP